MKLEGLHICFNRLQLNTNSLDISDDGPIIKRHCRCRNVSKRTFGYDMCGQRIFSSACAFAHSLIRCVTGCILESQVCKVFFFIRKTITSTNIRHFKYIENFTTKKNENFQTEKSGGFHISAQNIDCGYSLEPPWLAFVALFALLYTRSLVKRKPAPSSY